MSVYSEKLAGLLHRSSTAPTSGQPWRWNSTAQVFEPGALTQANSHQSPDTDSATSSLHHTIGTGATQAAAGNHTHAVTNVAAKVKASDETVNNSSTLQNDDDFSFAMAAGETWVGRLLLLVSGTVAAGIKLGYSLPTGATYNITGVATASGVVNDSSSTGTISFTGTAFNNVIVDVAITNGANAGNAVLQWSQDAATPVDTKVLKNSTLMAMKVT